MRQCSKTTKYPITVVDSTKSGNLVGRNIQDQPGCHRAWVIFIHLGLGPNGQTHNKNVFAALCLSLSSWAFISRREFSEIKSCHSMWSGPVGCIWNAKIIICVCIYSLTISGTVTSSALNALANLNSLVRLTVVCGLTDVAKVIRRFWIDCFLISVR